MCRIMVTDILHTACTHYEVNYVEVALCHRLDRVPEYDPELCPFLLKSKIDANSWREGFCEACKTGNKIWWRENNVVDYDYCPTRLNKCKHTLCGHTQRVYNTFRNCAHTRVRDTEKEVPGGPPQYRDVCPRKSEVVYFKDSTMLCLQCQRDCNIIGVELEPAGITSIDDEMKCPFESKATGLPEIYASPEATTIFFAPGIIDPNERPVHGSPFPDIDSYSVFDCGSDSDSDCSSDDGTELFDHDDDVQRAPDDDEEVLDVRVGMLLHLDFASDNTFQFNHVEGNLQYGDDHAVAVAVADNDDDTDDADAIDTPESSLNADSDTDDDDVPQDNTQAQIQQPSAQTVQNGNGMNPNQNQTSQQEEQEAVLRNTAIICGARVAYSGDFVLADWVYDIIIGGRMDLEYILQRLEHVVGLDIPISVESIVHALDSLRNSINEADEAVRREIASHPDDAAGFDFTLRRTYLDRISEVEWMLPSMQQILGLNRERQRGQGWWENGY